MMSSEEVLGLSDRIRADGRMTTAGASDDGDITAVLLAAWQTTKKILRIKIKYSLGRNQ